MKRVVASGIGGLTSLGSSWEEISVALKSGQSGITALPELSEFKGLRTRLGGKILEFETPAHYERKQIRSMSRGALMSVISAERALAEAELLGRDFYSHCGVAYGCCLAGPNDLQLLAAACGNKNFCGVTATSYLKVMSHSFASSIAQFFKLKGRLIPAGSACTSGSQSIGFAYETIKSGANPIMIAGGAEEFCIGLVGLFDAMGATATSNDDPENQPKPFDKTRDGIVLSEAACTFILEERDQALARRAPILAELCGFATNCCTEHVTQLDKEPMVEVMRAALESAKINPSQIAFLHMHGTATEAGDICESMAAYEVFGGKTPVTALKSYFGHTLGACGALEAWCSINMLKEGWVSPIKNLSEPDPRCAPLNYVKDKPATVTGDYFMINNFAFGGVNTSLVFRKPA